MKAVQITEDNYRKLGMQYDIPELEMKGAIGFWLVAPFGRDARPEGYLTKTQLLEKFDLGGKIKHGWYDLVTKAPVLHDFYLLDSNGDPQKVTEEQYFNPPADWSNHMDPFVVDYQAGNFKQVYWTMTFNGIVTSTNPGCIHLLTKVDGVVIMSLYANSTEENSVNMDLWAAYLVANDLGAPT